MRRVNAVQARINALQAIEYEREQQDRQWGGSEHDDRLSDEMWVLVISKHVGRLAACLTEGKYDDIYRQTIVIGALALAFAEQQQRIRAAQQEGE